MSHHIVHIKASPKQLSKLRNGHKVRISPAVQGTGFNLIVHPERIDTLSKTFTRGKGMEIQLTPQEIAVNQEASPQMEGSGIFGHKFDKFLADKGLKKGAYAIGDTLKPAVKAALVAGLGAGATALAGTETVASGGLGASAIPLIYGTAGSLGALGMDYLDNPSKYQSQPPPSHSRSNAGGTRSKIAQSTLQGEVVKSHLLHNLNQETGNKYNTLADAAIGNAMAHKDRMVSQNASLSALQNTYNAGTNEYNKMSLGQQPTTLPTPMPVSTMTSYGFGIHKKHIRGGSIKEKSSVGTKGGFVSHTHLPPALTSQPFSANFQFQHFLPPAYQKFSKGGGLFA